MKSNCTVLKAVRHGASVLSSADNPQLEAEVLLSHYLNESRSWIAAHPEKFLSETTLASYNCSLQMRNEGEPLPYLLGYWEFFGISFTVDKRALIPRPETETIVEHSISIAGKHPNSRIVDVGTGCGAIAIALALNLPDALLFASDISLDALSLARTNSLRHAVHNRIEFVQADLLTGMGKFDVICANPPYLTTQEACTLSVGKHEPRLALDGGRNGLNIVRKLISTAGKHLNKGGSLLMEIGNSSDKILKMAKYYFGSADCSMVPDLAGRPRMLKITT
ncbi:MAG: protein-(glutamine-N5) methyltransferase, release factor-specific [Anaerolineaceae bacterium]|nr:protein-(glutamine-N5) methyltransferase, release factor-specific [Anaerolineaceae bacterium]